MSALRGLIGSAVLRRESISLLHPYNVRQMHLAIPDAIISSLTVPRSLSSFGITVPLLNTSIIPILTGIWDSILRAVPKKKTSHSQKRKRQLVGKGLKDKTNLTRCEAC